MNIINIIKEELDLFSRLQDINLNERHESIFTINDLAAIMKRMGYDDRGIEALQNILLGAFNSGGDDAVIDMYERMTGTQIEAISRGRYMFTGGSPLVDPERQ